MDDKLLDYYNRELAWLREMGAEFAACYPKVAARLALNGAEAADPWIERLLEGTAFLTARIQLKMDAQHPHVCQQLLEMLAPGYLAPVPSMAIAQLHPDDRKGDLSNGFCVARGTMMESEALKRRGVTCRYTTAHEVNLQPLRLKQVALAAVPADIALGPLGLSQCGALSALRISLECFASVRLNSLNVDSLMFFLSGGEIPARQLLELVMRHRVAIVCQVAGKPEHRLVLPDDALRHEGFAHQQALLPDDLRNFSGYRLLQEYFAFPARFLFFSISQLGPLLSQASDAREFDIIVLLDKHDSALERIVDSSHLALHCTPVINLFPRVTERQKISHSVHEHHLVVDAIRPLDYEIFSVQKLCASSELSREERVFRPFWQTFSHDRDDYGAYFTLRREPRRLSLHAQRCGARNGYRGCEVFLSLVDQRHAPWCETLRYLWAEVTCSSRDLPLQMLQQEQADFVLPDSIPVRALSLRYGPTPPRPALAEGEAGWRLIGHLQTNYLSLMDGDDGQGAAALRQLLALYANQADAAVARQLEGIRDCQLRTVYRRLPEPGPVVYARGVAITLTVDEQVFSGSGAWLLGSVLETLFSRLVTINSFTELTLHSQQRGEIGYWAPRIGSRTLL